MRCCSRVRSSPACARVRARPRVGHLVEDRDLVAHHADPGPAAVAGRYDAQGRDIYGQQRVTRMILELRADIQRGDSGGPLVLVDGTVGGIVFAESRSDEDVGYALAPTAVAGRVDPAIGRTSPVSTGECVG